MQDSERLLSVFAGTAAIALGLINRSLSGKVVAGLGAGLLHRGMTGHCPLYQTLNVNTADSSDARPRLANDREQQPRHVDVLRTVTVQKSVEEVYAAWKRPEILEQAFAHLATVVAQPSGELRWTVRDPLGYEHTWVTQLVDERLNERMEWRSEQASQLAKTMIVSVRPAPADRGTELSLQLRIEPPSGVLGKLLQKLFGKAPAWVVERALANLKCLLEAGELPSLARNPSARSSRAHGARS